MKKLAQLGLAVGFLTTLVAGYLQFVVVEAASVAEARYKFNRDDEVYFSSTARHMDYDAMHAPVDYGMAVFFMAILTVLLCLYPAIKKEKLAYVGLLLGVLTFFVGAAYGTHMFS